jgi:radical SAM superfamily enzyme YgiQ (UPF0313 family)
MDSNNSPHSIKALIIDLNNFSRYPTLSVGYLSAILKQNNVDVDVLSPLFFGVHGFPRRVREPVGFEYVSFLNHLGATTSSAFLNWCYRFVKNKKSNQGRDENLSQIKKAFISKLKNKPDVVLISAYTMYFDVCADIAKHCSYLGIPLMIGGNSFVVPEIARKWSTLDGVTAIYAGEPENRLYQMVIDLVQGNTIHHYDGVFSEKKVQSYTAKPLQTLDQIPFPDFSAFPWSSYPNRILPIMTGRGCEWGRCKFCSDVLTSAGRTYRSRSLDNVLQEIAYQRQKHKANLFVFLDLKLNSNLFLWRGLAEKIPEVAPQIKWTASVHVDSRTENGLSYDELKKARNAGLVRITCGLESGSQAMLNHMSKGVKLKQLSKFVKNAHRAGLSVRLTSIIGEPNETANEIKLTTSFLREHRDYIERIVVNRFVFMPETPSTREYQAGIKLAEHPHIKLHSLDTNNGIVPHTNTRYSKFSSMLAVFHLLAEVNKVNRKPLMESAKMFEGAF